MGCGSSKVDDLRAVALCRERLNFLDEAIQRRYHLADSHSAYLHSLNSVAVSLPRFFNHLHFPPSSPSPSPHIPNPNLNLPPAAADSSSSPAVAADSHLQFLSESDDDDDDDDVTSGSLHHSSPSHHLDYATHPQAYLDSSVYGRGGGGGGSGKFMNYMQRGGTPSVTYEDRSMNPLTGRMDMAQLSFSNDYQPTREVVVGGRGSFPAMASSESKSPPSPPRTSPWDFLNIFEAATFSSSSSSATAAAEAAAYIYHSHPHTPSRNSKEVRQEEGIPDLEDLENVGDEEEVVKQVQANPMLIHDGTSVPAGGGGGGGDAIYRDHHHQGRGGRPSTSSVVSSVCVSSSSCEEENTELEFEVDVMGKNVVGNHQDHHRHPTNNNRQDGGPPGVPEVFREIQILFQKASDSGNQLSNMLEVGKVPHRRQAPSHVSSKVSHVISPSSSVISSQSSYGNAESFTSSLAGLEGDRDMEIRSINLSSTLQKCYLWEKKLYKEVKEEEKLRIIYEKNCQKLKCLNERGADAHKLDSTRTLIRSLSTKLRFAIQVVERISVNINKLRDEELWPQINELIQGLTRMWKSMLECHRSQCEAIKEARNLDAIALQITFSDDHLEATLQLERELIDWTLRFSGWIGAQKGYVKALNNWLMTCLLYEPEETPDGIAPFSPGRIDAPPLFVVCNQWCQAMERLSEKEVVDSIRLFAVNVLQLWEQDKLEMRARMVANKDLERTVKGLERKDQKIQKGIQELDKMALTSEDGSGLSITEQIVYQAETSNNRSLQANLEHIFEAMERLASNSTRAYVELMQSNQEDMVAQEEYVELP